MSLFLSVKEKLKLVMTTVFQMVLNPNLSKTPVHKLRKPERTETANMTGRKLARAVSVRETAIQMLPVGRDWYAYREMLMSPLLSVKARLRLPSITVFLVLKK
jgi:hypothetical protein